MPPSPLRSTRRAAQASGAAAVDAQRREVVAQGARHALPRFAAPARPGYGECVLSVGDHRLSCETGRAAQDVVSSPGTVKRRFGTSARNHGPVSGRSCRCGLTSLLVTIILQPASKVPTGASPMIAIIDYGMGNLRSVQKAIEAVGHAAEITSDPDQVRRASKVILPGVGAFADAIAELRRTGLGEAFCEAVRAGKPCLGVCLGLQLLFDVSEEDGEHPGLGPDPRPGRPVRARARPEDPPHGLEHAADPQALARSSRGSEPSPRSTSSTPTMPGPTTRGRRRRGRPPRPVRRRWSGART